MHVYQVARSVLLVPAAHWQSKVGPTTITIARVLEFSRIASVAYSAMCSCVTRGGVKGVGLLALPTRPRDCRNVRRLANDVDANQTLKDMDSTALPKTFCIIEDRHTVQDFAKLQLDEIRSSIQVSLPPPGICVLAHIL